MDQKTLQKSMGRIKTANKFRMETEFDKSALSDNSDIVEEKEDEFNTDKKSGENSENSESESDSDESVAGPLLIVEKILRSRNRIGQKGVKEYLLKWKSFSVEEATWETEDNMDCKEMICEFEKKPFRGRFLVSWSTRKILCNIRQKFSFTFDARISKVCKKLNTQNGFVRADQNRAKKGCQMGQIGSFAEV